MKNNEEGIQPIQPAVSTENAEPVAPAPESAVNEPVAPAAEPIVVNEAAAAEFASEETAVSDELLQELHESDDEPTPRQEDIVFTDTPKKSHGLAILIAILLVGAIAAAGVFAYLYFTKPSVNYLNNTSSNTSNTSNTLNTTNTSNTTNNSNTSNTTNTTTTTTSTNSVEGTAITNSEIVSELTEKTSLLFGYHFDDNLTISTGGSAVDEDVNLIVTGNIEETYRINHLARKLSEQTRNLTDEEVDLIEIEDGVSLVLTDKTGIDGDVLAEAYKDLFGEMPAREESFKGTGCSWSYNASVDVYYYPVLGCGGIRDLSRYYHITDFTEKDKNAYVYIQVASTKGDSAVLCDVSSKLLVDDDPTIKVCAPALTETTSPEEFFADTTADFARYRFVFNQADDGSYYFVKVEKV